MYTLDEVKKFCLECNKCRLCKTRNSVVFGEGNENADIMFIGEGPGYNEDMKGRPFVGKAGQLLDKMLSSIGIDRKDVYIANIVKCRPPENRNPLEDEQEACIRYLRWQVKLIKPKIIVCLGSISAKRIISPDVSITGIRGKWYEKKDINIISTYHPSYLLRNESAKKAAWEDMKSIANKYMEIKNCETTK